MRPLADLLAGSDLPDGEGDKDARGAVVLIGGPVDCPGGILLAGTAALRTGAGRVHLVVHPDVATAVAVAVPEAAVTGWDLARPMPHQLADQLQAADAVAVGPGCGHGIGSAVAEAVAAVGTTPLVLDAGGVHEALEHAGANLVIAPNTSEAARLVGSEAAPEAAVDATPAPDHEATLATALAARLGAPVAVRGARCAVADPAGSCWLLDRTPSGLGTPGSGDVLVGVLTALLAAGLKPVGALGWAIALHAAAGARLASTTPTGYLARDLLTELPAAIAAHRSPTIDGGAEDR